MASLALLVTLMIFGIFLFGPFIYFICLLPFLPIFFKKLLAVISIAVGIYWIFLPVSIMRFIGLLPIFCGWKILDNCKFNSESKNHE